MRAPLPGKKQGSTMKTERIIALQLLGNLQCDYNSVLFVETLNKMSICIRESVKIIWFYALCEPGFLWYNYLPLLTLQKA